MRFILHMPYQALWSRAIVEVERVVAKLYPELSELDPLGFKGNRGGRRQTVVSERQPGASGFLGAVADAGQNTGNSSALGAWSISTWASSRRMDKDTAAIP